jgi:hypothetical protein
MALHSLAAATTAIKYIRLKKLTAAFLQLVPRDRPDSLETHTDSQ